MKGSASKSQFAELLEELSEVESPTVLMDQMRTLQRAANLLSEAAGIFEEFVCYGLTKKADALASDVLCLREVVEEAHRIAVEQLEADAG